MNTPKVSVCIATYNRANFLGAALQSVPAQTEGNFEIVVSDDASTDETPDLMQQFVDARIRYVHAPDNKGIAANRNRCLDAARGRYIAWLDSDDLYEPDMLSVQCAVLDDHPDVAFVHGGYALIDAEGRSLRHWGAAFDTDVVEASDEAFRELIVSNYITAPTVVVRRQCHDRVGPYATDIGRSSTDWDMWLRLALQGQVAYTARPLAKYRQHDGSISQATSKSGERLRCDIGVVDHVLGRYGEAVPDISACRRKAHAALTAKAIFAGTEAVTLERWGEAEECVGLVINRSPSAVIRRGLGQIVAAASARSEYAHHRWSKRVLTHLAAELDGTRLSSQVRRAGTFNPEWDRTMSHAASVVRRWVPAGSMVLAVDKWDPTLLHLSQRPGWHFPHRPLLPTGYPVDSVAAVQHLEQLRRDGAAYLIVPAAAFWWLEHYVGFHNHLETQHRRIWRDAGCALYHLGGPSDS